MKTTIDLKQTEQCELKELPVPEQDIIRRLGYPPGTRQVEPGVREMLDRQIQMSSELITARGMIRFLMIKEHNEPLLMFENTAFEIQSRQVSKMLRQADLVALFMVTIGKSIEDEIVRLQQANEVTEAFILDAVASEMADAAADIMHRDIIKKKAEGSGLTVTPRFSPGYGDWPVTVQKDILDICEGGKIGISVNASSLMSPRKSVSAVLGLKRQDV